MRIGVFDSGVGGLSVVNAIKKRFPEFNVTYIDDKENIPYGSKSKDELKKLVTPIIKKLAEECDIIVIACNTASTVLISDLRKEIPIPLIAMEPMVKPAASKTKSKIITVCATPTTLSSDRYRELKESHAEGVQVLEPDCSLWSSMIQSNSIDNKIIEAEIEKVCSQGADVIVLGCTHYHWIEEKIKRIAAGRAVVLQPEQPVLDQLERIVTATGASSS